MITQIMATPIMRIIGSILKKNSFNSEFAGVNNVNSEFAINQSNEKNDSLGVPIRSDWENIPLNALGILTLKVKAVDIS